MTKSQLEKSIITDWIYEINKPIFFCVLILIAVGLFISLTINPGTSRYINNNLFSYFNIQALYLLSGFILFILFSFINYERITNISIIMFVGLIIVLFLTLIYGVEIKGSRRWINLKYITIMPIELIKPFYCIILAAVLNNPNLRNSFRNYALSFSIYAFIAAILVFQPDISQLFLVSVIYFSSIFMSGFSIIVLTSIILAGCVFFVFIYLSNFNVQNRINSFLSPNDFDATQTELSLQAIKQGGLMGVGPGNGVLKNKIPEANSDYIFSVIAEEYGLLGCLIILTIFFIISYQGFKKIYSSNSHFIQISLFTLIIYFCLQALIHIGVNIRLLPTTGITLPFISYGGSSVIGMSITCGFILSLSKNRHS